MTNHQLELDRAFQALADPARRGMVERLTHGPASVSDLAQPLSMSLPSVMQHLAMLEQAGLVRSKKQGRVRTCELDLAGLSRAEQWINQRRREWEQRLDLLGDYLKTIESEGDGDA